jgi:hypothetical protein
MFYGQEFSVFAKGFHFGAKGAIKETISEFTRVSALIWSVVSSEKAIAAYKLVWTIALYVAAVVYVLADLTIKAGRKARVWCDETKAVAIETAEELPAGEPSPVVRAVVRYVARFAARTWVAYWQFVQQTATKVVLWVQVSRWGMAIQR